MAEDYRNREHQWDEQWPTAPNESTTHGGPPGEATSGGATDETDVGDETTIDSTLG